MTSPPEFISDGCTGFPEVWRGIDLTDCCYLHDLDWFNAQGDLTLFLSSNVELANCFAAKGVWELWLPALAAVTIIGIFLFLRKAPQKLRPCTTPSPRLVRPPPSFPPSGCRG